MDDERYSQLPVMTGQQLEARRLRRGWSPAELARRAGVRTEVVYRMERGIATTAAEEQAVFAALGVPTNH